MLKIKNTMCYEPSRYSETEVSYLSYLTSHLPNMAHLYLEDGSNMFL
jgi:hypothetical protein